MAVLQKFVNFSPTDFICCCVIESMIKYKITCYHYTFQFQSAIWSLLNHYAYADALFLAERLFAEGLFMLDKF